MEVLAILNLGDFAQAFSKMGMFPVFDLAYYIVSILYLKYEPGSVEVSRRSPVASWLCAMLYCFGSYIVADLMLGSSPIDYFQHNSHILLASAVCPTKASLYGAILFTLQEAHWLPISKGTLILIFTLFMATSKVVMTARHSHGSPFALIESWICHLLFGSPLGGSEVDHHHPPAAVPSSPLKTKEELSEGARKRKAKKAE
eukprot:superscaffoldBa00006699_g21811